jgi:hypothetical protein
MNAEAIAEKYGIDLSYGHTTQCPRCARNGGDTACNNLRVYGQDQGAFCWACSWTIPSAEHREAMGWDEEEEEDEVTTREKITDEENERIKSYTSIRGKGYRGIRDETNKFFGVRYEYDDETGEPIKQYVPTTIGYELAGYRVRKFPKDFNGPIGQVGKECDMIGEFRFKNHTRTCLIVGGEIKMLAAYQMLKDDLERRGKGDYETIAVVCSTLGEGGAYKQVQSRYSFFNQFQKIIICMDNDKAGEEAAEKVAKVLPKGRAYIMKMRLKDADEYIKADKEKDFISDFWNAQSYVPAGVVGSGDLPSRMLAEADLEKIPFPEFMEEINEMTGGGASLGKIVNIGAASGIGKTVYVDTIVEHVIFNSPHQVGVVSMELNAGQYGISMLSRFIGVKINNIVDREERIAFLKQDWVQEKQRELFFRPDGSHRWHLVDDRDGSIDDLKAVVEELIIGCDCKVIVLDPIQDILDGLTNDEQAVFLKWQKGLIKSHNVTFMNINHVRKSSGGGQQNSAGAMISEEDFAGSSTIFKSAALNILLRRDKMAEDPIERNTTYAYISKNRDNGNTGPAGEFYYDGNEHRLYNKKRWLEKQPAVNFVDPTETVDNETGEVTKKEKKK